jgi:hypothetical protein
MIASRVLQGALDNVQRFCGYRMLSILPSDRLRWLANRGVLRDVLVKLGINCVLDVGANRGQYGMALRGIGCKGWVYYDSASWPSRISILSDPRPPYLPPVVRT